MLELYHIMLSMRSHGWTRNLPSNSPLIYERNRDLFTQSFDFILPGYNVRPLEMCGALGSTQLDKLPSIIKVRRENGKLFQKAMTGHRLVEHLMLTPRILGFKH